VTLAHDAVADSDALITCCCNGGLATSSPALQAVRVRIGYGRCAWPYGSGGSTLLDVISLGVFFWMSVAAFYPVADGMGRRLMSPWSPIGIRCTVPRASALEPWFWWCSYGGLSVGCRVCAARSGSRARLTWINAASFGLGALVSAFLLVVGRRCLESTRL